MASITTDNDFINACNQLISEKGSVEASHTLVTVGDRFIDRVAHVVIDEDDQSDITPPTLVLEAALDRFNTATTAAETVVTAQSGLLDKAALAQNFASEIRALFNQVWDETENSTTQNSRFEDLATLMESQPNALKNRFKNDLLQELGIDFDGLGENLAAILLAATPAIRRQYCLYLRMWIQGLVFLLIINKVVN